MERIRLTMAQALVRFLDHQYVELDGEENKFVRRIYGVFGHGCVVGVGQALSQGGHDIRFLQGKNEQNMALSAMAFAKQKNRREIIPCVSSIGPGAMNMVTAAGCATANRIPLLLLPGDTFACRQPDPVLQQAEFFQSFGQTVTDAFRGVCHYFDRIERPEQLMTAAIHAMRVLTDPADTGAVCIAMPQDVEGEAYDYPVSFFRKRVHRLARRVPESEALAEAAALIAGAKKPLLICGGGVRYSEAHEEFRAFAEATGIPFGETQAGKSAVVWDHPLNLGGIGVTGCSAANEIARDADVIIGVGTRYTDFTTSSKWLFRDDARFVNINVSPFQAVKMDAAVPVVADAKRALPLLQEALKGYRAPYTTEVEEARTRWRRELQRLDGITFGPDYVPEVNDANAASAFRFAEDLHAELTQTAVLGVINECIDPEDVVIGAAGSLPGDMQRMWRPRARDTYHMEYGYSCMGYEISGALGVKYAVGDRDVYAMTGDGSFIMLHSELLTAVQAPKKINVCLFNNASFGCINNLQVGHGNDTLCTELRFRGEDGAHSGPFMPVDFAKIAEGYGCRAYTIHTLDELRAAIAEAKTIQGVPVLFDIRVLPKSMTEGYGSWWRVGDTEVSENPRNLEAYRDHLAHEKDARKF